MQRGRLGCSSLLQVANISNTPSGIYFFYRKVKNTGEIRENI